MRLTELQADLVDFLLANPRYVIVSENHSGKRPTGNKFYVHFERYVLDPIRQVRVWDIKNTTFESLMDKRVIVTDHDYNDRYGGRASMGGSGVSRFKLNEKMFH